MEPTVSLLQGAKPEESPLPENGGDSQANPSRSVVTGAFQSTAASSFIRIRGARQNNLKNIDLDIPRDKLVVITGLSGSGKSSLAFDTLYAEGQRRYVESLSAYARQFLGLQEKPDVDQIDGLSPAVSIDQKSTSKNPRSTVGTVTEVYDYLRLLFARIGVPHDPKTGQPLSKQSLEEMIDRVLALPEGSRVQILAPIVRGRKGEYRKELEEIRKEGFTRARIDGETVDLSEEIPSLERYKQHTIEIVIDRLVIREGIRTRVADSMEQALKRGKGVVVVHVLAQEGQSEQELRFSEKFSSDEEGFNFDEIEPRLFSFNSPYGACPECHGLGFMQEFDPQLIAPDRRLSIHQGALRPFTPKSGTGGLHDYQRSLFEAAARRLGFTLDTPLNALSESQFHALMYGVEGNVTVEFRNRWGRVRHFDTEFPGVIPMLERRLQETSSDLVREELAQYQSERPCPACRGKRLKPEALCVLVGGKNIAELCAMPLDKLQAFFDQLTLSDREAMIARQIIREIKARLGFLLNVGLDYLTLDRSARTLAGGEAQRIRLATQIGSGLMGVLYILDEPSIGLHQRDNTRLINTLKSLRDLGNTVLVVEHDQETMEAADWIIDIGPGAGEHGGQVVAQGTIEDIRCHPTSITGQYLSGRRRIAVPEQRRAPKEAWLELIGARQHNLKNVTLRVPLGLFVVVTGVSGSGKSTLIQETLYPLLMHHIYGTHAVWGAYEAIRGLEFVDKVVDIDQAPIGRTPRSNPATYTGAFDLIRDLFSRTPDARMRGYEPGRFSFNVKGGRCENCKGDGILKIEMQFLPDVYIPCEVCKGKRYNRETLEVKYRGKSIADVLDMTVSEALQLFENLPPLVRKLKTLHDVGLDYIRLGQPATTLSGGEAQRVKLATELAKRPTGRTIYILDEPTTGLHFADVEKLIGVLNRLVDAGNTVLVIEHNLDVIKTADWVVDLGPEGGDAGGRIIAEGPPEKVAEVPESHTGRYLRKVLGLDG
ncbi:excinuclease ABC, A subunit [Chthonomonas calidirosea]|uniref:UvrABC system protein A n=1 Tax=Chthonomonas calidirosea (strain DSM 23976 / ICMP 18418 / T49) TaxID=1303518 RepID=S0EZ30_CHTCT|nr:excinuclease ABC subunit UvrA [Chthonomonas calidirosea]CCW35927.1 excinuclease ABC, A subunit [Chthonomonas calidirosea T49]CEK18836.1 excinuclease ABC, A subunit [Chthonomonas calidirosea]